MILNENDNKNNVNNDNSNVNFKIYPPDNEQYEMEQF